MELLNSSVEQLVEEISSSQSRLGRVSLWPFWTNLATHFTAGFKNLQWVRLLQTYRPSRVYLALDPEASMVSHFLVYTSDRPWGTRQDAEQPTCRVAESFARRTKSVDWTQIRTGIFSFLNCQPSGYAALWLRFMMSIFGRFTVKWIYNKRIYPNPGTPPSRNLQTLRRRIESAKGLYMGNKH